MNADDRANPTQGTPYTPASAEHPTAPQGSGAFARQSSSGQQPQRSSLRPTTGEVPQGSAPYAPTPAPAQRATSFTPVSSQQPTARTTAPEHRPATTPGTTTQPPVQRGAEPGVAGALGAGVDRLKVFATKAKDDLTAGDDVAASRTRGGPRKVRVLVSRVDPWSTLKIGFLLSIAMGIMMVVAVYVLWGVLNGMGFFALTNEWVSRLFTEDQELNLLQFFDLNMWMSAAILVAVVNVVLLTAMSAIGAFLFNTISRIVGGVYLTLTDD